MTESNNLPDRAQPPGSEIRALPAFLLTRHWRDTPDGLELSFWLKSHDHNLLVTLPQQRCVFFIPLSLQSRVEKLLANKACEFRPLELKNFKQEAQCACYFSRQQTLYEARRILEQQGIEALEADIRPHDRYLMERFIHAPLALSAVTEQKEGYLHCQQAKLSRSTAENAFKPTFSVLSFDIETNSTATEIYSIALRFGSDHRNDAEQSHVLMRSLEESEAFTAVGSERELIQGFCELVQELDPDILIGWNHINFDLRVLQDRARDLGLPLCLGRNGSRPEWRQSQGDKQHYTLTLAGRVVLDGIDSLKSATYQFESFSLDFVAHKLLKRGKLIHGPSATKVAEITRQFLEDKAKLAHYNLEDCQLVWDVFAHCKLIEFAMARATMTGLAMDRFGGSVAAFDFNYLPKLHRQGYIAPNLAKDPQGIGSPGGYVMCSKPGMYKSVLVLDFKSLYPSIIRTFRIDPLSLVEGLLASPNEAIKDQKESHNDDTAQLVSGFNGAIFHKSKTLLPSIIEELWTLRDQAKATNNAAQSQAIKILMNSFYGVLGTPGCRFFDSRLPSSITLRGQQILKRSSEFIEKQGYEVIYGDTDSLFIWLKQPYDEEQAMKIGKGLSTQLNTWWTKTLRDEKDLSCYLEVEFETHFSDFLMPTIRGSNEGSKKRYAGICEVAGVRKMIFKGLESVRSDWTILAREFQRELYWRLFNGQDYREYIQALVQQLKAGEYDQQLVYRKRLRRPLKEYQKNVPPHVQAALKHNAHRAKQGLGEEFSQGGSIAYYQTLNGPEPQDYLSSPLDYDLYIERQIEPIADGILHFFDDSFEQVCGDQFKLF